MPYRNSYGEERSYTAAIIGVVVAVSIVLAAIGGFVWLVGSTWSSTNSSEMTCVYNGGPLDSRNFKGYVEPGGGRKYQGFASSVVDVPTRLVQYRISKNPEQGDTPTADFIPTLVKGYRLEWEPTVTFTLNTLVRDGKPVVCDLIEKHLRAFHATDFDKQGGNWQYKFLNERWRPVLQDVFNRVMQNGYDPGELKFNTGGARDRAAAEIGAELNDALIALLGDDYFCDSDYRFGQDAAACGSTFSIVLGEPGMSAEDENQLSKPQRAKIDADNSIAAAQQKAREANETATAKQQEAESAEKRATAEEEIAKQNNRVQEATAVNTYAWCEYLVQLGQNCALVKAAEQGDFPAVFGSGADVVVPLPTETPTTTAAPAPAG